jgi:hypothetical protein
MGNVVSKVSQVDFSGIDFFPGFHGLGQGEMSRVGFISESIDDKDRKILELGGYFLRHFSAIGDVSGEAAALFFNDKAMGQHPAMGNLNRMEAERAQIKRAFKKMGLRPDIAFEHGIGFKGVGKDAHQTLMGFRRTIDREGVIRSFTEAAQVVKTDKVIVMSMSANHGIQSIHPGAQGLKAEIRCGIDQNRESFILEPDRGAQSLIFGICGAAYGAGTTDHGNPLRRACSEKGQTHGRRVNSSGGEASGDFFTTSTRVTGQERHDGKAEEFWDLGI